MPYMTENATATPDVATEPERNFINDVAAMVNGDADTLSAYGLSWSVENVSKSPGGNASSKTINCTDAQILTIESVPLFRANFPNADEILRGIANGTSLRVTCQDVNRRNPRETVAWRRTTILGRVQGIRHTPTTVRVVEKIVTVEKVVRQLPNGTTFAVTPET